MRHCLHMDVVVANDPTPSVSQKFATKLATHIQGDEAMRSPALARSRNALMRMAAYATVTTPSATKSASRAVVEPVGAGICMDFVAKGGSRFRRRCNSDRSSGRCERPQS